MDRSNLLHNFLLDHGKLEEDEALFGALLTIFSAYERHCDSINLAYDADRRLEQVWKMFSGNRSNIIHFGQNWSKWFTDEKLPRVTQLPHKVASGCRVPIKWAIRFSRRYPDKLVLVMWYQRCRGWQWSKETQQLSFTFHDDDTFEMSIHPSYGRFRRIEEFVCGYAKKNAD